MIDFFDVANKLVIVNPRHIVSVHYHEDDTSRIIDINSNVTIVKGSVRDVSNKIFNFGINYKY